MSHDPNSELLSPAAPSAPPVAERADRREYSEWDPRSAPGTYFLLIVNVGVYLWMLLHGVSATDPTVPQLIHYGANQARLVLDLHQWYRVLTATFVHIGLIHIAGNMWCLWNLGLLGEPLIGPWGLIAVYVLTGIVGNLLSLFIDVFYLHLHQGAQFFIGVGAGASGAVFGIAGILIMLLSNRRLPIPWSELRRLRTSVVRFSAINLAIGLSTTLGPVQNYFHVRIDNAAHLGGFLAGIALGPALVPRMTAGRAGYLARQKVVFAGAAFLVTLVAYGLANFK